MVSRIRIGPEGGPFVKIDEDNGTLKLESPSGDIDLQSNKLINALFGNLDLTNSELQNAVLLGATLGGALNADGQDINNVGSLGANQVGTSGAPVDVESEDINNADTVTTQDLVVNGTATGVAKDLQGCRVFLSANQNIVSNTGTKIQFDSITYDSGSNFDTSTHDFTCPETGLYLANLQVSFIGGGSQNGREVIIGDSNTQFTQGEGSGNEDRNTFPDRRAGTTTVNKYTQGDTISGYAKNSNSSDILQSTDTNLRTIFEVAFLGSL